MVENVQTFGEKIRALRLRKGLNQSDLAKGIVTPSMISQIESDRAKPSHGVLTQIADRLECSLEDLIGNTTLNFKTASQYNMAKALIIDEEYSSALRLLDDLSVGNLSKIEPFEVAYLQANCYVHLLMLDEASSKLEYLSAHTELHAIKHNYAKVQYLHGLVEMKRKCYQLAEHHFKNALHAMNVAKINDEWMRSSALMELAKAQQELGKLTASLQSYQLASSVFESRNDLESLGRLYLDMAQSYLDANKLEESSEYAQRAMIYMEAVNNTYSKLLMELRIATIQASTGNRSNPEQKLKNVAEQLLKLRKTKDAGIAYAELAKLYLESQRFDLAEETAQTAKKLLPPNHSHSALALRVFAKVAQARKQMDSASRLFRQSADCYKLVGCYKEFEIAMQELSDHYAQIDDVQMAYKVISDMLTFNLQAREARGIVL